MFYLWMKALHIISFVAWMVGLLYLPRLFVYHAQTARGSEMSETFKKMERRLLKGILTPALCASWIFGLGAAWAGHVFPQGWFHVKLLLLIILSGFHGYLARCTRQFAADQNQKSARFFRLINEIPTIFLIAIVLLAIFKPF